MNPVPHKLKSDWRTKENIQLVQKRRRRYLHFDEVLETISPFVFRKVTNPNFIAQYGFLPLLRRIQRNRFYKKDPATKKKVIRWKERPISYAAHFDSLVYSWYAHILETLYEKALEGARIGESVIAYRQLGKSNFNFAKDVFDFILTQEECVAIALDIKGFYDNLNHRLLKKQWVRLIQVTDLPADHYKVYKSVTNSACVPIESIRKLLGIGEKGSSKMRLFLNINLLEQLRDADKIEINTIGKGIPQGTPISCVLSNLYMFDFDIAIVEKMNGIGGLYRRYSDDIIVICPSSRKEEASQLLFDNIDAVKLEIERSKIDIRYFEKRSDFALTCRDENGKASRLQYLGVEFDGKRMDLRHKGYAKFERNMTLVVRREVAVAQDTKFAIAKRKIYERFTPLGKMNYVTYAQRAASVLEAPNILKKVEHARLMKKIKQKIRKDESDAASAKG